MMCLERVSLYKSLWFCESKKTTTPTPPPPPRKNYNKKFLIEWQIKAQAHQANGQRFYCGHSGQKWFEWLCF